MNAMIEECGLEQRLRDCLPEPLRPLFASTVYFDLKNLAKHFSDGGTLADLAVPVLERPYSAVLAALGTGGTLDMASWHTCDTTHCMAGWIVRLAGDAGRDLEWQFKTAAAAGLILHKSRPDAPPPNFYGSNDAAMTFIVARAQEE